MYKYQQFISYVNYIQAEGILSNSMTYFRPRQNRAIKRGFKLNVSSVAHKYQIPFFSHLHQGRMVI